MFTSGSRLLGLPRVEKAKLASPHPYRGWRQWPDDFGRLELERFNVAQFDDIGHARAAGLADEYLGLYAHANVWPADDPGLSVRSKMIFCAERARASARATISASVRDGREPADGGAADDVPAEQVGGGKQAALGGPGQEDLADRARVRDLQVGHRARHRFR